MKSQELSTAGAILPPKEVDKRLLTSFPSSVRSALTERWDNRSTPEHGWDGRFEGYSVGGIPADDLSEAIRMTREAMTSCDERTIMEELTRLRISTKSRAESDGNIVLTMQIYAELLVEYPKDVVVAAMRFIGSNEKFWPALAEVKTELEYRGRKRRLLLAALETAASPDRK